MYTYEYERVYVEGFFRLETKGHEEVIARRAEDGWRYVGFIPVVWTNGALTEMDLIFEKKLDKQV